MKAIIALLLSSAAAMAEPCDCPKPDQIDYVLRFNTEKEAKAELVEAFGREATRDLLSDRAWKINVWRSSQDTVTPGPEGDIVRHNFLAGYYFIVSFPRTIDRLVNHDNVVLVLNRNKCEAKSVGCVVRSTVSPAVLRDIRFSPVPGDIPFGNLN